MQVGERRGMGRSERGRRNGGRGIGEGRAKESTKERERSREIEENKGCGERAGKAE